MPFFTAEEAVGTELQIQGEAAEARVPMCQHEVNRQTSTVELVGRKDLLRKKQRLSVYSLAISLIGIGLMILQHEISWYYNYEFQRLQKVVTNRYGQPSSHTDLDAPRGKTRLNSAKPAAASLILKCLISLSTVTLLGLILAFHYRYMQFFMKDNSLEDWRITLSSKKILWILLELVVCLIHPFPTGWGSNIEYSDGSVVCLRLSTMDIVLSIMMFLRLYQIHRVILLHSNFLVNASYRSIGSLNKVKLNFRFILKVLMDTSPGKVLLVIIICLWLLTSWTLSLCERQFIDEINVNKTGSQFFFEAAYLVPITFLTIGYGDIVPVTVCGKMVCLFTGVMGVGCTALLVAVAANKLQLNKAQKYVLNFMHNIQYKKQIEAAAATVLQLRWRL
ncbi:small conductance calcium-activated potassium channel protein 2, partial [Latimeria chalumnae]|uniref:small conductance calcium-activated potassium channel protein 2 n=1 Tax=Latimeria chalumnae TaxID=7897 RepID=UPI00313B5BDA